MLTITLLVALSTCTPESATDQAAARAAAPATADTSDLRIRSALAMPMQSPRSAGRSLVRIDPVEYAIVTGAWKSPPEGWTRVEADAQGNFTASSGSVLERTLAGGYLFATVDSPTARVMLLDAAGHGSVFVNELPRGGDPYASGMVLLPVELRAGENEFLFSVGRGQFRATLVPPPAPAFILDRDLLLPSIVAGRETEGPVGAVIINASTLPLSGARVRVQSDLPDAQAWMPLGTMPPLTVKKIALPARFTPQGSAAQQAPGSTYGSNIQLVAADGSTLNALQVKFKVISASDRRVVTRNSTIDDSAQYYSLVPTTAAHATDPAPGILLSLHGASVEATSQANAYKPKKEANIVCPTNRRPFGFDWEDWGRLDAAEALAHARKHLEVDPAKVWLTGHSMGGHGAWQVGAQFPGTFAAIAPSAGWISFSSYTGARKGATPADQMLARAASASDTLLLKENYLGEGVYILHGDADDNVPVDQAREMFKQLAAISHPDFQYYERPGAGHWWGDECVDWPPLMQFLFARTLPNAKDVTRVRFSTVAPQVSHRKDWVRVLQQERPFEVSRVDVRVDPQTGAIEGTTGNVTVLELAPPLDAPADGGSRALAIRLDAQALSATQTGATPRLRFVRRGTGADGWQIDPASVAGKRPAPLPASQKKPARGGPFKMAYAHGFVAVVGTQGSAEANALLMAKARLDAESWWMRGNGRFEIALDTDFDPGAHAGRNVVLYGNRDENAAWQRVLGGAEGTPEISNGKFIGPTATHTGDDLALLCIRPRADDPSGQVGIVAATGATGMRALMRVPVFLAGVGIPDLVAWRASMLRDGAAGIMEAGYFGNDWSIASGTWMQGAGAPPDPPKSE